MKSLLIVTFCAIVAVSFAEIDHHLNNKYGQHYTQHEDSVAKAREGLQQRLSTTLYENGDAGTGSGYSSNRYTAGGSSGNNKYVTGCSTCYGIGKPNADSFSSRLSSSSSSTRSSSSSRSGIEESDYLGVGTVGHSADNDDLQQRVVPSYHSSGSSQKYTGNAYDDDEDDLQQRHVPADLSNIGSSAYRSSASRANEEDLQRNTGSTYVYQPSGTQNSYSRRQESASQTRSESSVPATIPVYSGSHNSRGSSNSDSESYDSRTIRPVQPGQYVAVQARPGQTIVLSVPVRAGEQQQYTSRSEHSESTNKVVQSPSNNNRITYRPHSTYAADKAASSSDLGVTRVGYTPTQTRVVYQPADQNRLAYQPADQTRQQPEKYVNPDIASYNSYNPDSATFNTQERYGADDELEQVRVAPVQITGPTDTRYSTAAGNRAHVSNTRIVPSSVSSSSSSSSRSNAEREERRTQSRPTYVNPSRTTSTQYGTTAQDESSFGSSQPSYNQLSQTQNQRSGSSGYTSHTARLPQYSSSGSTREGSGILSANNDDLSSYMSESKRLADQQSRQISSDSRSNFATTNAEANRRTHQSAANHQANSNQFFNSRNSDFDLGDVGTSANGNNAYQQSWQKQSKWASGSEYGPDGQPKTYSHLTTAESEKHKINGHEEGYKAATTTLENDGKVSTYSIRTP
ncbi:unnamed protein product [Diamesa serratosioi]